MFIDILCSITSSACIFCVWRRQRQMAFEEITYIFITKKTIMIKIQVFARLTKTLMKIH